jgi:hypothetical protein
MLKIITSKGASQIAVVKGFKRQIGDYLNNLRLEASRHLRNKKKIYLKDKFNELAKNNRDKSFRDLYKGLNNLVT